VSHTLINKKLLM